MPQKTSKQQRSSRRAGGAAAEDRTIDFIAGKLFRLLKREGCPPHEGAFMLVCAARIIATAAHCPSLAFHETLGLAEEGVPFDPRAVEAFDKEASDSATRH